MITINVNADSAHLGLSMVHEYGNRGPIGAVTVVDQGMLDITATKPESLRTIAAELNRIADELAAAIERFQVAASAPGHVQAALPGTPRPVGVEAAQDEENG